jgi:general secretion pathway protein D
MPHVIPNPLDNTLLVQGTPQEWEQIRNLLRQLDVAPRQVLIDAKIYELDLSGAFESGIEVFLEKRGSNAAGFSRALNVASSSGLVASGGALVLRSSELLAAISLAENQNKSRVIASPSIIATDSVPAIMNVGQTVPVLTSTGIAVTGSSFQSISSVQTGTTLNVLARVNSSGIITMVINQEVSNPSSTTASSSGSNIDSPSFSTRHFTTQVTVQDGETVAIGGFIQETKSEQTQGIPLLDRVPLIGPLFGSKSYSKARTELVVFMTPRVIYDASQISDATDEIKSHLKKLQKDIQKGQ